MGLHGGTFLLLLSLMVLLIPIIFAIVFAICRKYNDNKTRYPGPDKRTIKLNGSPRMDLFSKKSQIYQDSLFMNTDPLSEIAPLNYDVSTQSNCIFCF